MHDEVELGKRRVRGYLWLPLVMPKIQDLATLLHLNL